MAAEKGPHLATAGWDGRRISFSLVVSLQFPTHTCTIRERETKIQWKISIHIHSGVACMLWCEIPRNGFWALVYLMEYKIAWNFGNKKLRVTSVCFADPFGARSLIDTFVPGNAKR